MSDTRKRLLEVAVNLYGIHVATWSPGDGQTRYRFIDARDVYDLDLAIASGVLDYFGASGARVLGTTLGLAESWVWLRGFMAAEQRRVTGDDPRS